MAESLRDQIAGNLERSEAGEDLSQGAEQQEVVETPDAAAPAEDALAPDASTEAPETDKPITDKPAKVDGRKTRAHGPDGKFLPKGAAPAAAPSKPSAAAGAESAPIPHPQTLADGTPAAEPAPVAEKINRPTTWRKEHWGAFDKLAAESPAVAKYILEREAQYAQGVSTYKHELDRVRPFMDSVKPHLDEFQRFGIDPAKQIGVYANIHRSLAMGTPQQKLQTFLQIAQDYQVPVQELFQRGEDGNVYFNQNLMAQMQQRAQQAAQQPAPQQQQDVREVVRLALEQERAEMTVQQMLQDEEKYPHAAVVRETMAQILEAGLAHDLPSAYEAALRLPQHNDIYAAMQEQQRAADVARAEAEKRAAAERARKNAFSTRSSTPTAPAAGANGKGIRSALESSFDNHASGRV